MKLQVKLTIVNLLFKILFVGAFFILMPQIIMRINIYQTDNELIDKREKMMDIISQIGAEPFLNSDSGNIYGSYNILKEEFISLEHLKSNEFWNFIEVTQRQIEGEIIDYRVLNYSFIANDEMFLLEIGKSLSSIQQTEHNIKRITIGFLIIFLLISVIWEFSFYKIILRPLNLIIRKIKQSPNAKSFDRTPVKTNTSDFRTLDATLIQLMNQIELLFEKEKEITQNISHELLTPISVLRGKLENMLRQEALNKTETIKIEESLATLFRLKTLVNSFLLIARIESDQFIKEESVSIHDIINNIVEELNFLAADKQIELTSSIPSQIHLTPGNPSLIFTMFYNIVNNAIKYSPQNSRIRISATIKNQSTVITIEDEAGGISDDVLAHLFTRFGRKITQNNGGNGIGLAITKAIADFHHIQIKVNSQPGKGTQFQFIF
ncbi:sensor histidine kinase [Geofilum sp. OHC36d9]|uniref:sensor histidine kinase n=1 Tax=Geofilum sp. OHC36d9 TaxID=3458413 RepID=UPI004033B6D6